MVLMRAGQPVVGDGKAGQQRHCALAEAGALQNLRNGCHLSRFGKQCSDPGVARPRVTVTSLSRALTKCESYFKLPPIFDFFAGLQRRRASISPFGIWNEDRHRVVRCHQKQLPNGRHQESCCGGLSYAVGRFKRLRENSTESWPANSSAVCASKALRKHRPALEFDAPRKAAIDVLLPWFCTRSPLPGIIGSRAVPAHQRVRDSGYGEPVLGYSCRAGQSRSIIARVEGNESLRRRSSWRSVCVTRGSSGCSGRSSIPRF